jgi:putative tryptophan/tyrosine transport system substrate-binding protein
MNAQKGRVRSLPKHCNHRFSSLPYPCYLAAMRSILVAVVLLACGMIAEAQHPKKIPVIGRLAIASKSVELARMAAFAEGLREAGYSDGKNIVVEWRFADGIIDRLPALAAELVRRKVDVIVTSGSTPTLVVKAATTSIPIVMSNDNDPVADGFVASWARPGGNITGLSNFAPELSGKRLEILKEVVPKLSRVAILGTSTNPAYAQIVKEVEAVAKAFEVKFQLVDVLDAKEIESAFRNIGKTRADGLLVLTSGVLIAQRMQIAELAARYRLATMYSNSQYVEAGGLMYYGANVFDLDRRSAVYVDKILKGSKPAELPVEQPMKFEFVINRKAAKKIGLTIPPNVLVRATKVIK